MELSETMQVGDLFAPDRNAWDSSAISRFFGSALGERIQALPLPAISTPDRWVWRASLSTRPGTADLYSLFHPSPPTRLDLRWLWRLRILPRVRLFLWKVAWGRLPTRALLASRGLPLPPGCPFGDHDEETTRHVLFQCRRAIRTWRLAGLSFHGDDPTSVFLEFLRRSVRSPRQRQAGMVAAYLAYHLWLSRNRFVFEGRGSSERVILALASEQAAEFFHAHMTVSTSRDSGSWDSSSALAAALGAFISWEPPPPLSLKVNFDGSARGDSGGAGFVIRGPDARLLAAGGSHLFGPSALEAELHAAWLGISYACRQLQARRLCIEGDSSTVVSWIRDCWSGDATLPLLVDIQHLLAGCASLEIRAVLREANSAADWVASFVADHSGEVLWTDPDSLPRPLSVILYFDLSGRVHTRWF